MNGYVSLDFYGLDLLTDTSGGTTAVDGLYAAAKEVIGTGKPIFVVNAKNDSKACTPIQAIAIDGSTITIELSHYSVAVASTDVVTITDLIPEVTPPTSKAKK